MKEKELYSLRDKSLPFHDFEKFKKKIENSFYKNLNFPVVVGYKEFPLMKNLSPLKNSDKLTVQNFFGGLEEISEENKNRMFHIPIQFKGNLLYIRLETLHYSNWNNTIFLASMSFANSKDYSLTLTFLEDGNNKKGYHATSGSFETTYDKIMENYLGPNKE